LVQTNDRASPLVLCLREQTPVPFMEGWLEGSAAPTPANASGRPLPSLCLEGIATGRLGGVSGGQGHPMSCSARLPSFALFQPNGPAWSARRDQQVAPAGPTSELLDAAPRGGGPSRRVGGVSAAEERGAIVSWAHGITGADTIVAARGSLNRTRFYSDARYRTSSQQTRFCSINVRVLSSGSRDCARNGRNRQGTRAPWP